MFGGVLGLLLLATGAGALYSLRGDAAGPHALLKSESLQTAVTLGIVLLIVFGVVLLTYGFMSFLL